MNDLIEVKEKTVLEAFSGDEGLNPIIKQVKELVENFKPDTTTVKGRAAITSLASNVARFKTKLDGMGKDLTAEWKEKSKAVDKNRKNIRDELDALKVIARQPLTDWEAEQEARIAAEEAEQARIEQERIDQELAESLRKQYEQNHEMALLLDEKYDREAKAEAERVEQERVAEEERLAELLKETERIRLQDVERDRIQAQNSKMLVFTNYKTIQIDVVDVEEFKALLKTMREMQITPQDWDKDFITQASLAKSQAIIGIQEVIGKRETMLAEQAELKERRDQQIRDEQKQIKDDRDAEIARKKAENRNHQRAINNGIVAAMVELGTSKEVAQNIVEAIARKQIANITITY